MENYALFIKFVMPMKKLFFVIILIFISVFLWSADFSFAVLNVGQGLCVVIQDTTGKVLMYDCGTSDFNDIDFSQNEKVFDRVALPYLKSINAKAIDIMVLSHPHTDHFVGLKRAFDFYYVGAFLYNGYNSNNKNYSNLAKTVTSKLQPEIIYAGQTFKLGKDVNFQVFSPISGVYYKDPDCNSIVLKVTYKDKTFLLTGDLDQAAEPLIMEKFGKELQSHVLVCGGHGTKYSSTDKFLNMIKPKYAIISCGINNPYHLPHEPLLKRLRGIGATIYRTDTQGNIVFKVKDNQLTKVD
ncbi:MAG: MBL fold metallo-hydrolase [Abditibacteriota bacterium]|nr:MBL fold metallo-hydrolase [Abditibacteriota bacterium]